MITEDDVRGMSDGAIRALAARIACTDDVARWNIDAMAAELIGSVEVLALSRHVAYQILFTAVFVEMIEGQGLDVEAVIQRVKGVQDGLARRPDTRVFAKDDVNKIVNGVLGLLRSGYSTPAKREVKPTLSVVK